MEVKVENLSYKDLFQDLNFFIKDGCVTALLGKNGSGKTSFLNLLFGLDLDFEGNISIEKISINKDMRRSTIKQIRKKISYVRQNYEEDLFDSAFLKDIEYNFKVINEYRFIELLDMFDLDISIFKKNCTELSSSEIKKMLLINAFIKDSKIILLDDPTRGLDQKSISSLIKLLKREKRNHKLIIVSTQDTDFLLKTSDEFIIIENSKVQKLCDKYYFLSNKDLLKKLNIDVPNIINFKMQAYNRKKIKLVYRDNINDLLKDIYRNANKK